MRRTSALAAALTLLAVASGAAACTDHERAAVPASACVRGSDPRAAATALLAERARALRTGDRAAFLATIAPDRSGLAAEQRGWFDRVRALPRHTVDLGLSVNRAQDARSLTAYVTQDVRIAGTDARPVGVEHLVTFERYAGCWVLTADERDPTQVAAAPWDLPSSHVDHRDGVVLVSDLGRGDRARVLADTVTAWRAQRRLLGRFDHHPDDRGVVVMTFVSPEAMEKNGFYHQSLELTGAVTLPATRSHERDDLRVIVAPALLDRGVDGELRPTLRHEFAHVLLAAWRRTPLWATEGAAEYYATVASGASTDLLESAATAGTGMPTEDFYADTQAARAGNYTVAWAAMRVLAAAHGRDEPARLLRALDRAKALFDPDAVERVLRQRYGFGSNELGVRARAYVDRLRGVGS